MKYRFKLVPRACREVDQPHILITLTFSARERLQLAYHPLRRTWTKLTRCCAAETDHHACKGCGAPAKAAPSMAATDLAGTAALPIINAWVSAVLDPLSAAFYEAEIHAHLEFFDKTCGAIVKHQYMMGDPAIIAKRYYKTACRRASGSADSAQKHRRRNGWTR